MAVHDNPNVGIVGYGVVGKAVARTLGATRYFDPGKGCCTEAHRQAVNRATFTFVCVPTPMKPPKGAADVSAVVAAVNWIESEIIVIRSTVPPGTTEHLRLATGKRIVFQPEYLGETAAHPMVDHHRQGFTVLGGSIEDTQLVADLYATVYHAGHRFVFTDATTAELAKYMENCWLAMKVTFCNEFFDIALAFGVSYHELREAWLADWRVNRDHTFVYPHDRGWAGKCLPKDVAALIAAARGRGMEPALMRAVEAVNTWQRDPDRDHCRRATAGQEILPGSGDRGVGQPSVRILRGSFLGINGGTPRREQSRR